MDNADADQRADQNAPWATATIVDALSTCVFLCQNKSLIIHES